MSAHPEPVYSQEAKYALGFARELELARLTAGVGTDKDTVYEPWPTSTVRPIADFTVSTENGTFLVTVEWLSEETAK